jgi:hypothetical protein
VPVAIMMRSVSGFFSGMSMTLPAGPVSITLYDDDDDEEDNEDNDYDDVEWKIITWQWVTTSTSIPYKIRKKGIRK